MILILYHAFMHDAPLVLIEEPENHMHPDMQRRLLQVLKRDTSKQYVFASHSNVLLDFSLIDRTFFCAYE